MMSRTRRSKEYMFAESHTVLTAILAVCPSDADLYSVIEFMFVSTMRGQLYNSVSSRKASEVAKGILYTTKFLKSLVKRFPAYHAQSLTLLGIIVEGVLAS